MKEKIKITKENLIKDIANQNNKSISDVKDIYNTLERTIFDILSSVETNGDISIRLFEGISLDGVYIPEKTKHRCAVSCHTASTGSFQTGWILS